MSLLMDALESAEKAQSKRSAPTPRALQRPGKQGADQGDPGSQQAIDPKRPYIRSHRSDRQAARRLFEAHGAEPFFRPFLKWPALATWAVPLLVLLIGGGWYLFYTSPSSPTDPVAPRTSSIEKQPGTAVAIKPPVEPAQVAMTSRPSAISQQHGITAEKHTSSTPTQPTNQLEQRSTISTLKNTERTERRVAAPIQKSKERPEQNVAVPIQRSKERPQHRSATAQEPAAGQPRLFITRKRLTPLEAAFRAYRRGENDRAVRMYRQALAKQPHLREALLGLAAVAVREERLQEAKRLFQRVLNRDPNDSEALAGVLDLSQKAAPAAREKQLRELLQRHPASPHLHFVLGSILVAQRRWEAARDAFSNAYRLDERNGDAAFNLAISLDQLGQKKAALTYYKRALELARNRQWGFSPAEAQQRIKSLGASF